MKYARPVVITEHFVPFLQDTADIVYEVTYREVTELPTIEGNALIQKLEYQVFQTSEGLVRQFLDSVNGGKPYAVTTYDWSNRSVLVQYIDGAEKFFCETGNSLFHVGWEKVLSREGRMILHAACVDTSYGGILFAGPSGAGKSTQAELWCRYVDAVMVNGDRPIIGKKETGWRAYGSPYAGSSRCHRNVDCGIRAVVMVKKASDCRIRKLDTKEAFRKMYAEITVNSWDGEYVSAVSGLIMDFISVIPVFEMECTPDIQSVELLEKMLSEEGRL